jgi:hypothetical protein
VEPRTSPRTQICAGIRASSACARSWNQPSSLVEPALTPALALDYLDELSTDIRGAVLLDADRRVAAAWRGDTDRAERLREPLIDLLDRADAAAGEAAPAAQVEVTTGRGAVFCVRDARFTLAVVTGRFALPSLVFYDLRHVLQDLREAPA